MSGADPEAVYQAAYARYRAAVAVYQTEVFSAHMASLQAAERQMLVDAATAALYAEARLLVQAARVRPRTSP